MLWDTEMTASVKGFGNNSELRRLGFCQRYLQGRIFHVICKTAPVNVAGECIRDSSLLIVAFGPRLALASAAVSSCKGSARAKVSYLGTPQHC